jgi:hypothetical protein
MPACIQRFVALTAIAVACVSAEGQTPCNPSTQGFVYHEPAGSVVGCVALPNVISPTTAVGTDACAQINYAIDHYLPASGGVIDARGYTATSGQTCSTSINIDVPGVTLEFGPGTWTFNGNPGIQVSAPNAVIQCSGDSFLSQTTTVLTSGAAYPLIANFADAETAGIVDGKNCNSPPPAPACYHTRDGTVISGCDLDGNNIGTFGIFAPAVYSMKLSRDHVRAFTGANIMMIAAQNDIYNVVSDSSGGDGIVLGGDSKISGMSQSNGNAGTGLHLVSGGNVIYGSTAYQNGLHGVHVDGNNGSDWTSGQLYLEQKFIIPTMNNPGGYAFYVETVGTTNSTPPPGFCQTVGCTVTEASPSTVVWINVGNANLYGISGSLPTREFYANWDSLDDLNISSSNCKLVGSPASCVVTSGDWDDILLEGISNNFAQFINVSTAKPTASHLDGSGPVHGIHVKYGYLDHITDTEFIGGAWPCGMHCTQGQTYNADLGGVYVESSGEIAVRGLRCNMAFGPCLGFKTSSLIEAEVYSDNGGNGVATSNPFVSEIDSGSSYISLLSVKAHDSRTGAGCGGSGTGPCQNGVSNGGTSTTIKNEQYVNVASGDAGVAAATVESFGIGPTLGSYFYNTPTGQGYNWLINSSPVATLVVSGLTLFNAELTIKNALGNGVSLGAANGSFVSYSMAWPTSPGNPGYMLTSSGGGTSPMNWQPSASYSASSAGTGDIVCIKNTTTTPPQLGVCTGSITSGGIPTCSCN